MITKEQFDSLKVGDKVIYIPTKRLLKKIREAQANAIKQKLSLQLEYPYCCSHCEGTVLQVFKDIKNATGITLSLLLWSGWILQLLKSILVYCEKEITTVMFCVHLLTVLT